MPFTFDGSALPPDAAVDPEELLKRQQRQQAQQAPKEQPQSKKPQQQKKQPDPKKQPGALDGIEKFLEEKLAIPVVDFFDNTFQGNQKSPDDIARDRAKKRQQFDL